MSATATIADVLAGRARWCVVHGDCAEVLPTLPAASVAHVITDPPYEAEAHTLGRRVGGGDGVVVERPLDFAPITEVERLSVSVEVARIVTRWCLAFCQIEAAMKWRDAFVSGGLNYRRSCIWVKPGAAPQFTGDRPGMGYETIVAMHAKGRSTWNGGGKHGVFTHTLPPHQSREHTTQKPLPLMLELVELFTDPDELVLDPFAGSGTTGVACLRLGRRFIGVEKDAKYAQVARERLAAEVSGLSLRDARAGQLPMFGGEP